MNILEFYAALVDSLAWPVAAIVALLLLRERIAELLSLIEIFKYNGLEVHFRRSVHDLRARAERALSTILPEEPLSPSGPRLSLNSLAKVSPRAAVLEAWLLVETAAGEAIALHAPNVRPTRGVHMIVAELLKRYAILDRAQLEIFRQLRDLRNKAVHINDAGLDSDTVSEYIDMACALAEYIGTHQGPNSA